MQDVFGRDGLFSDAVLQERGVLRVVFRQAMAVGCHVNVLGYRVDRERHRWRCTAGEHVVVANQLDHVRGMPATSALDVVDVYAAAFEVRRGVFEEAGFVEAVGVDVALDVVLFAYTAKQQSASPYNQENSDVKLAHLKQFSMVVGVQPKSSCNLSAMTPALTWS